MEEEVMTDEKRKSQFPMCLRRENIRLPMRNEMKEMHWHRGDRYIKGKNKCSWWTTSAWH